MKRVHPPLLRILVLCCMLWSIATVPAAEAKTPPEGKKAAAKEGAKNNGKDTAPSAAGGLRQTSLGHDAKKDDVPVFVKSTTLHLDSKKRVFTYKGNVEAVKGDM